MQGVSGGNAHGTSDDWTDQEVLLLLEAVEMYDDDWSLIEEHVGTRSAQQCIRKFLELPIEDPYLAAEGEQGPLKYARVPFEQADNPVMSVVAFLAGVVGPGVAAEAAKTALHELTKAESEEPNATAHETENKMEEDDHENRPSGSSGSAHGLPHSKVARAASLALASSAKAATTLANVEDAHIRSTLGSLIKLTLNKLDLKMKQFEELEEVLEDERRNLESARMKLIDERVSLRRTLEAVRAEIAKSTPTSLNTAASQASVALGQYGQPTPIPGDVTMEGDHGPLMESGSMGIIP